MKRLLLLSLLGLAACSPHKPAAPAADASSAAPVAAPVVHTLDCTRPVPMRTPATQVAKTYGAAASAGDLDGPEGTKFKGVTLNPGSKTERLDLSWWDDAQSVVSMVRAREDGKAWTGPGGIHVGSTLAEVEAANGKPFSISGFGWDYGGYVTDLKGGALASLPGGCSLQLRFDSGEVVPDGISGDGVTVASDDPRVRKYAPVVTEMAIGWPLPDGVKPSADDGGGD